MFKEHTSEIQIIHDDIISVNIKASSVLFHTVLIKKKVIPGWNNYVERYKKDPLFWYYIWKCNFSPRSGIIGDIRNNTCANPIRPPFRKRNKDVCSANQLAAPIVNNKNIDF